MWALNRSGRLLSLFSRSKRLKHAGRQSSRINIISRLQQHIHGLYKENANSHVCKSFKAKISDENLSVCLSNELSPIEICEPIDIKEIYSFAMLQLYPTFSRMIS